MALDPRIEAVRDRYGLAKDDFWQIPQNRQWVCKHAALEIVATKANVEWTRLEVIEADTANGIAVMVVGGKMGDREEWATGEASPKNNKNAYPWAMAEKRGKDRVVLKLVGIHGLVYSEDEADDFKRPEQTPAKEDKPEPETTSAGVRMSKSAARPLFERLQAALNKCETPEQYDKFWQNTNTVAARQSLPADWERDLIKMAGEHIAGMGDG